MIKFKKYFYLCVAVLSLASCTNLKKATYFNNIPDSQFQSNIENLAPVLRENDLLSILVSSLNPGATEVFNPVNSSETAKNNDNWAPEYLIDEEGYIRFPFLGKIKAAGKTKQDLREEITNELIKRKLLVEPIVNIRYLNFKVSVMGEVENPAVLTIPSEKVSLLEALSLAGDLTIYAQRDNVLLIREENGVKNLIRIDLTSDDIFTSPNYYLKPNDVLYVQPNESKVASTSRLIVWLPVIISALSFGIIAVTR
ncbi:polysaccharide export outer membrane protein [Gillisia sp. Hel_I_86]|uniref:polysaccharide biosynthesis/export family protein n=1 Tax=Gillisia sp. Hel_I_86 TaxID=1249981 RepID=UPI00119B0067|nr:polysaccharide biosynthesis/export family protein [Gillisia sp. Hel_I_86]TVZ27517.1 polysaccharide export outer membrane protein [Gillisia sp. Hel_I_86]